MGKRTGRPLGRTPTIGPKVTDMMLTANIGLELDAKIRALVAAEPRLYRNKSDVVRQALEDFFRHWDELQQARSTMQELHNANQ